MRIVMLVVTAGLALGGSMAGAAEDYARWPLLTDPFPSTGGGGIMIGDASDEACQVMDHARPCRRLGICRGVDPRAADES